MFSNIDGLFSQLLLITVTLGLSLVLYFKWAFSYWKRQGLETIKPSIPFGNFGKLMKSKCSNSEQFAEFYNVFRERGLKHGGVYAFTRPFYVPTDPAIIKDILLTNFSSFVDRGFYVNEEQDPLSAHLFSLEGEKWKNLRAKLTATFTSGKMKMMFETIANCSKELDMYLNEMACTQTAFEVKDTTSKFTTDIITSCAFGLECDSMKNPESPMRKVGVRITENTTWENLKNLAQFLIPAHILKAFGTKLTKPEVEKFILDLVRKTVVYRETNQIVRKDFLHLLIQLKNKGIISNDDSILGDGTKTEFSMDLLAAQVFVFFVAGYETSSSVMSFALYELSQNQQIQNKVREEIEAVLKKHDNQITYQAMMEMTYLEQVINESMRKYPPVGFLNRKATKEYRVPNSNVTLQKDTMVVIPVHGIHRDSEYYPEPDKFDPERFSVEGKGSQVPFTFLPFGDGPRVCIGLRFGLLQSKVGLVTILRNYKITINPQTKTPIIMNHKSLISMAKDGIWLNITKIK